MKILIIGAAGMVGRKLSSRLAKDGSICGNLIEQLTLFDVIEPEAPSAPFAVNVRAGDLESKLDVESLIADQPDLIFHLAAIVSGDAEKNFEKGYGINLDGTRNLIEAIRASGQKPKLVFTSSIAVFGAPFPEAIYDEFHTTPLTSYGTQKAICELLISDYSRKGILDGYSLRFPTICVRPGKPNLAASGFFSNIIREPLVGEEAILPVSDDVLHWHASPRAAVGFLLHAATLHADVVGPRRAITMPGVAATVADQIEALHAIAGEEVVARIRREPDEFVQNMVAGWPRQFDASRAIDLGFKSERDFKEIIEFHIADELGGRF